MLDESTSSSSAQINPDGLTYRRKPSGSPFNGGTGLRGQAMSCFLCGQHRPRSMLRARLLLGKHHMVCSPSCKTADEVAAGGGA